MSKLAMGCAALERQPCCRIGGKLTLDDLADTFGMMAQTQNAAERDRLYRPKGSRKALHTR